MFVSMSTSRLFMSYLCDIFLHLSFIIFITIKNIMSLTLTNLFFGYVCQKLSLGVFFGFPLFFCQSQGGAVYKKIVYTL